MTNTSAIFWTQTAIWRVINHFGNLSSPNGMITQESTSDGIATTPISKAEALSRTSQSAFTVEGQSSLPTLPESIHSSIEEITITEPSVFALLCQTDPQKNWSIPARVLK